MDAAAIWDLERAFWTGPPDGAAAMLDPACLMAFPDPTGLLAGAATIAAALAEAPRWDDVTMADRRIATPAPALVVLGYRAAAQRGAAPPWCAFCTSTWRRDGAGWRLVQHQQTPD